MLAKKRRFQGLVVVAILLLAMIGGLMPDPFAMPSPVRHPKPSAGVLGRLADFFIGIRYYSDKNMNFAASAPILRGIAEYEIGESSSPRVWIGRNGHLFFFDEQAAAQSAGTIYRADQIRHFVDIAANLRSELARHGAALVVAIPPNGQSVAVSDLPGWAKARSPLEYDLAMDELRQLGVTTVDLKTPLAAKSLSERVYRQTDTHWSWRGAVAAFNLVVAGAGHPEWQADPAAVLGPVVVIEAGDLARMMGIQRFLTDSDAAILPGPMDNWRPLGILHSPPYAGVFDAYAFARKGADSGARVLVLGDSFTEHFWLPLFERTDIERIGWIHHGKCTFDYADVVRFNPTLVILVPTEREMPCPLTAWPLGLPANSGHEPDRAGELRQQ